MICKPIVSLIFVVGVTATTSAQETDSGTETQTDKQTAETGSESKTRTIGDTAQNAGAEMGGAAIKLESVFVGDKEQPAVSYFIPWQGVGAPDKLHWNVEQKHDQALDMVDRDVMLRSMHFYGEMNLENPNH